MICCPDSYLKKTVQFQLEVSDNVNFFPVQVHRSQAFYPWVPCKSKDWDKKPWSRVMADQTTLHNATNLMLSFSCSKLFNSSLASQVKHKLFWKVGKALALFSAYQLRLIHTWVSSFAFEAPPTTVCSPLGTPSPSLSGQLFLKCQVKSHLLSDALKQTQVFHLSFHCSLYIPSYTDYCIAL